MFRICMKNDKLRKISSVWLTLLGVLSIWSSVMGLFAMWSMNKLKDTFVGPTVSIILGIICLVVACLILPGSDTNSENMSA